MEEKDTKNIAKILMIVAVVLCIISLVLPWNGFFMSMETGVEGVEVSAGSDFYPWGGHIYMDLGGALSGYPGVPSSMDMWSILYLFNIGAPETGETSGLPTTDVTSGNMAATAALILSFIFVILALIFGLISILSLKKNKKNLMPLFAAIASLLAIIFFFAGINIALSSDTTGTAASMFKWTYGFFIIIISMILFFVSFGVLKSIKEQTGMAVAEIGETTPKGPGEE